jgi:hypothetical protein
MLVSVCAFTEAARHVMVHNLINVVGCKIDSLTKIVIHLAGLPVSVTKYRDLNAGLKSE